MDRKKMILPALLLALSLLLAACGGEAVQEPEKEAAGPLSLTVSVGGMPDTLDPARVTAPGGEMILHHLYENLMRWEDDGSGWAVLAGGQAESYEVETDFAGNATYTFHLREDAVWSDGQAVTAGDFLYSWRRLADPANGLPHGELLKVVSGYDEVQETGDPSLLAVSAPDGRTFVVTLNGSCAWFLPEICAGTAAMPLREGVALDGSVTNGPYTVSQFSRGQVVLERSASYGGARPETLQFVPSEGADSDYSRLQAGERDLITELPAVVAQELADSGWMPEPVPALMAVLLNTQYEPFDNPDVRLAFRLVVNTQAVVEALEDPLLRSASGVVPYGVADYGERPVAEGPIQDEPPLPDPNAVPAEEPEEPAPSFWDFRAHSLNKVTVPPESDYGTDCQEARRLLSQAGYPNGEGFPPVEYLYVESPQGQAVAQVLQAMWREQLGVLVAVEGLSQEEYELRLAAAVPQVDGEEPEDGEESEPETPPYTMAAQEITATYSDAGLVLGRWHSASPDNVSCYHSDAFDILLNSAEAAVSAEVRDAYLHDAEAILLREAPVIPLYCRGGGYLLRDGLSGLYRAPDGVYFLTSVTAAG